MTKIEFANSYNIYNTMELVKLAQELFSNVEIRNIGTVEEPLFIAIDVCKMLGLYEEKERIVAIESVDKSEKKDTKDRN